MRKDLVVSLILVIVFFTNEGDSIENTNFCSTTLIPFDITTIYYLIESQLFLTNKHLASTKKSGVTNSFK